MQRDDLNQTVGRARFTRPVVWLISAALFVALTLAGLWAVAGLFGGGLPRLDPRLFEPASLAVIGAFLAVYFLADGLRLYFVLCALDAHVPFRQVFPLVFINILVSNITPLATGGGVAQVWYLQKCGVAVGTSAAATTIRTMLAMLVIFVAAPLCQILLSTTQTSGLLGTILQSASVFIALYFAGFLILLARPLWLARTCEALLRMLSRTGLLAPSRGRRWSDAIRREAVTFSAGFRRFLTGRALLASAAALSTVLFLLTLFAFPAVLMTLLGQNPDWLAVIGTLSIVTFLMYFAPTPGGAGFSELAFAGLMAGQIEPAQLVLIIFVWRFLTIYLGMAVGVLVSLFALRPMMRAS